MSELDRLLPRPDWSERYERALPCTPEQAVAAFLAVPVAPDRVVATLLRLAAVLRADPPALAGGCRRPLPCRAE